MHGNAGTLADQNDSCWLMRIYLNRMQRHVDGLLELNIKLREFLVEFSVMPPDEKTDKNQCACNHDGQPAA